uniref:Uncharacterized protein n=1 Tax=Meloidogyne enterolobii TaxID=390850 RepID=A0A6V7V0B9_MELEN|nr:unnamed protein product [Meloidogyne enterolobii]
MASILISIFLIFIFSSIANLQQITTTTIGKTTRTFTIDKEANVFLMDGKPFRYISGEIHYFRICGIFYFFFNF